MLFPEAARSRQTCKLINQTVEKNLNKFRFLFSERVSACILRLNASDGKLGVSLFPPYISVKHDKICKGGFSPDIVFEDSRSLEGARFKKATLDKKSMDVATSVLEDSLKRGHITADYIYLRTHKVNDLGKTLSILDVKRVQFGCGTDYEDILLLKEQGIVSVSGRCENVPIDFIPDLFEFYKFSMSFRLTTPQSIAPLISGIIENSHKLTYFILSISENHLRFGEEEKKLFKLDSKTLFTKVVRYSDTKSSIPTIRYASAYLLPAVRGYLVLYLDITRFLPRKHMTNEIITTSIHEYVAPNLIMAGDWLTSRVWVEMKEEFRQELARFGSDSYSEERMGNLFKEKS